MTFAQRFFGRLSVPVCLLFSFLVMALPLLAQAASTLAQNPAMVDGPPEAGIRSREGGRMSSGDPCATSESYEHYADITDLTFARNGSCDNVINRFQQAWSFTAVN